MKILTVRQPWAHAIIHLGKDVENRGRNIAGSYRGAVAIHAALAFAQDYDTAKQTCDRLVPESEWGGLLYRGAIIGVVDLMDVHQGHNTETDPLRAVRSCFQVGQPYGPCSSWAQADAYHLVLRNPRPLLEPIPYKGALGLRTVPPDLQARIEAAL